MGAMGAALLLMAESNTGLMMGLRGGVQTALLPIESTMASAMQGVSGAIATVTQIGSLEAQNQALQTEVGTLQRQLDQLRLSAAEDAQLRDALGFKETNDFKVLAAQVVGRDPDGLLQYATIDRGSRDGLSAGMVVVSGRGLVGRIAAVDSSSARVQLLIDGDARANAVVVSSQVNGTISGTGQQALLFNVAPAGGDAEGNLPKVGDQVLTSGLGGTFPRGLLIGTVAQFDKVDYALTQTAELLPAVDFSRLQVVLVITSFKPGR
jgi:rod shape-determining protein MreC